MSVLALTAVLDHSKATGVDRLIMLALADSSDDYGEAYCSQRTMELWSNAPIDTMINATWRLQKAGEITGDITKWHWRIHLPGLLPHPALREVS